MSDVERNEKMASGHIDHVAESIDNKDLAQIDTVHNDEAVKVIAGYNGDLEWSTEEESKLRKKIDWKLMPILCITYGLQYYDKAMLGQAAIFGLRSDLHLLVGNRYSMASSIFYLGFIFGAYPAMYLAQRYPVERVASALVTIWGLTLLLTTQCKDFRTLYAQRFFLGMLESGISPMFMLVVASWYKKNEQAFRMGIWYSCTGYVSIFSPLVNFGWGQFDGGKSSWRYMFYFAGALTIVWGVLLLWILPAEPIKAKGFNERERYMSVARLKTNNAGVRNTHFKMAQVTELLLDGNFWMLFWSSFLIMISNGPISTFLPIIINSFGFSTFNSLLLLMPCGFWSGSLCLLFSYISYKVKNVRVWLFVLGEIGTTLSCLLLILLPRSAKGGLLFGAFILPSTGSAYVVLMGLQVANVAGYTKKSVASAGLFVGYCLGNFVGPLVFRKQDAPLYIPGFTVVIVANVLSILLMLLYRFLNARENKKRDQIAPESFDNAFDDDLTDLKNPQFRYLL